MNTGIVNDYELISRLMLEIRECQMADGTYLITCSDPRNHSHNQPRSPYNPMEAVEKRADLEKALAIVMNRIYREGEE